MLSASIIAFADLCLSYVVAARCRPGSHARDMKVRSVESNVSHVHFVSRPESGTQKPRHCFSAERRFEREYESFGNRAFNESLTFEPRSGICFRYTRPRVSPENLLGRVVRIVIRTPGRLHCLGHHAAFSRAVDAGDDIQARAPRPSGAFTGGCHGVSGWPPTGRLSERTSSFPWGA